MFSITHLCSRLPCALLWCLLTINFRILVCSDTPVSTKLLQQDYQSSFESKPSSRLPSRLLNEENENVPSYDELSILELEHQLAIKEQEQSLQIMEKLKAEGYEIYGFYHTSSWQEYWREVVSEQLYLLDGRRKFPSMHSADVDKIKGNAHLDYATYEWDTSRRYASLLNMTEQLYMNVVGTDLRDFQQMRGLVSYLMLDHKEKIYMNFNLSLLREVYDDAQPEMKATYDQSFNLSSGEYPTIMKLYDTCRSLTQQNKKALVYYLHSKGPCCWKDFPQVYNKEKTSYHHSDLRSHSVSFSPVSTWREYMNTMIIEFPSICMRAIVEKNYSTCGVENSLAHYSGNFWWADCDHVAKLDPLHNRFDWRKPEFWLMFAQGRGSNNGLNKRFAYRCGYAAYSCNTHLYKHECPRQKYRDTVWRDVHLKVPVKSIPRGTVLQEDQAEICKELRSSNVSSYNELMDSLHKYFDK